MRELIQNIPNALTLGNLACGCIGIERVMAGDVTTAFWLICIAAVLDFFDGFTARLLKADGEMGKQLDSLADLVTFAVLPGIVLFHYTMKFEYCMPNGFCSSRYAWLALPIAGAWRLARFNVQNNTSGHFTGVPTPITGLAFASLIPALELAGSSSLVNLYSGFYFLTMGPVIAAYLMVSDFEMPALKFGKGKSFAVWQWVIPCIWIVSVVIFGYASGPLIYLGYVIPSIIANFATNKSNG